MQLSRGRLVPQVVQIQSRCKLRLESTQQSEVNFATVSTPSKSTPIRVYTPIPMPQSIHGAKVNCKYSNFNTGANFKGQTSSFNNGAGFRPWAEFKRAAFDEGG
eukprot:gnl/TRDRNA2_/TRDRNA2_90268_c0_seq1.p1 gnl/TRDRNA2_/TRDRNA2_90268_c0~~gnl/TRDRNA2_/TRDRNA2_90268_c0_seq1.p1  ORF type:complete len:104 (+),score=5.67 gnl/TRDRNA2_/TRDRNA2_90268_c0_seq1:193-504(+)